jgi:hypothetical protein
MQLITLRALLQAGPGINSRSQTQRSFVAENVRFQTNDFAEVSVLGVSDLAGVN